MTLPNQLKSARMTDSTVGDTIDNHMSALETAAADILGVALDTNIGDPITLQPWAVRGLSCENQGGTSTNFMTLNANVVTFYAPGLPSYRKALASGFACGTQVVGVSGRDQSAAFPNSSWIHFYLVYNPSALQVSSLSSLTAPPTGPTLPAGFTHWCYMVSVYLDSGGLLKLVMARGRWVWYRAGGVAILTGGTATSNTSLAGLASAIPPNASSFALSAQLASTGISVAGFDSISIGIAGAGVDFLTNLALISANTLVVAGSRENLILPNVLQQLWYRIVRGSSGGTVSADMVVLGYEVPNGG